MNTAARCGGGQGEQRPRGGSRVKEDWIKASPRNVDFMEIMSGARTQPEVECCVQSVMGLSLAAHAQAVPYCLAAFQHNPG